MEIYFAPMEGITGYIFRNTYNDHYYGADKFYTPFIVANQTHKIQKKETKDIDPENNKKINLIPQMLGNDPEQLLWLAAFIKDRGYKEINLNCGCPAVTVVKKKKGAGLLEDPRRLDELLEKIYEKLPDDINISVKMRTGISSSENFSEFIKILNKYPLYELIVHPRTQKQQYSGKPDMDAFETAYHMSRCPVVYNGDINDPDSFLRIVKRFPKIKAVMIGRGLLEYPELAGYIKNNILKSGHIADHCENGHRESEISDNSLRDGSIKKGSMRDKVHMDKEISGAAFIENDSANKKIYEKDNDIEHVNKNISADNRRLKYFYNDILRRYLPETGEKTALFKMKELWCYSSDRFSGMEHYLKDIKKAKNLTEYMTAADALFYTAASYKKICD